MRIAGYKWLFIAPPLQRERGALLVSAFDAHEWTRGTNVASYPPSEDTLWGFNAYYSAWRARRASPRDAVVVGVAGFGTVSLFRRGWRSEKAEVVAVCIPKRLHWIDAQALEQLTHTLRSTYDVPVFRSLRRLRTETERWGLPGSAFLRGIDGPA